MTKNSQVAMYGASSVEQDVSDIIPQGAEQRTIYVDKANPLDASFEKYGHMFYNVYIQNNRGKWVSNSGLKYWEQNGQFRKILPKYVPVYPFEQMEEDLKEAIDKELEVYTTAIHEATNEGLIKTRFHITNTYFSHNGFTKYWTLLSDDLRQVVKGSYQVDDVVQIGLSLRNGIATGVAVGADFYTYRLSCMNGAVGRGDNFGSISVRHVGDQSKMIETFKRGIPAVIEMGQKIVEYYEISTALKFNKDMALRIYKKTGIAEKYFPEYFGIDTDKKTPEEQINLTQQARNLTLWEVFNDLTEKLTKSLNSPDTKVVRESGREVEKTVAHLGYSTFSAQTRRLHAQLVAIAQAGDRYRAAAA